MKSLVILIQHQLLKSVMGGKSNVTPDHLKLDAELVYKLFEQNCNRGDSLIGMMASGLLADMIPLDAQNDNFIT